MSLYLSGIIFNLTRVGSLANFWLEKFPFLHLKLFFKRHIYQNLFYKLHFKKGEFQILYYSDKLKEASRP